MIRAPHVPQWFFGSVIDPCVTGHNNSIKQVRLSDHILNSMCDMSEWLFHAMTETHHVDAEKRMRLHRDIRHWSSGVLPLVRAELTSQPELCCLRLVKNFLESNCTAT
jgi:hypothetical protein